MMNWFLKVINQYSDFDGRARRMEYWMFNLVYFFLAIIAQLLDNILGIAFWDYGYGYGPIYIIFALALLVPSLAVTVRRLHDVGKSGWMVFIVIIPIIGIIWFLVLMFTDSQPGRNEYGPNPKYDDENFIVDDTLDGHLT
jgi:uncharacterized membrane protein YhaH (DUF805 family)